MKIVDREMDRNGNEVVITGLEMENTDREIS